MRFRVVRRLESFLCLAGLFVLALAVLWPIPLRDAVPASTDGLFFLAPWEQTRPSNVSAPGGEYEQLQCRRYLPWQVYLGKAFDEAGLQGLLWNPLEGCGVPFMAFWRTRCLSPFSIPFYLLPTPRALQLSALLKLVLAGWFAYYAARRFGFSRPVAFALAVTFEFSGAMLLWLGWPVSDAAPWLPLLLISVERLAIGQFRYWPLGAVVVALVVLSGSPGALSSALLFSALYLICRKLFAWDGLRPMAASLVLLVIMATAALCLAAVQLAPHLEFLQEAARTGRLEENLRLGLSHLALAFLPDSFDSARNAAIETRAGRLLFVGIPPLILLSLWFSLRRYVPVPQRRRIEAMLATMVLMTGTGFALGRLAPASMALPLSSPQHMLLFNALLMAFVMAAAADEWLVLNAEQCKSTLARFPFYLFAMAITGGLAAYLLRDIYRPEARPALTQVLIHGLFALGIFTLMGITVLKPSRRLMGYSLALLTFLNLALAFGPGIPYTKSERIFPETSFVTGLKARGGRVTGSTALADWPLAGNGIAQTYAASGVELSRHAEFVVKARQKPLLLRKTGAGALVLTKEDIQGPYAPVRPSLSIEQVFDSGAILFNDMAAEPRVYVTYTGRSVKEFKPDDLSVDGPPLVENAPVPEAPDNSGGTATITGESPTSVSVAVKGSRPGILVLSDTFYPGWKASVNGKETDVFPVDGMFRGIQIDGGELNVEFWYEPFSLRLGLYITLGAALILLIELRHILLGLFRR